MQRTRHGNQLLEALPPGERRRIIAGCESVELLFAEVLCGPFAPIRHVYFPLRAYVALIMPVDDSATLEVGMVGNEGMFGLPVSLGADVSPLRTIVQGAGSALRMGVASFSRELKRSRGLRRVINRYISVCMSQLAQTAACSHFHVVEARLARWLLMTQDRAHADTFYVTQESLSSMLGVRRVGITKAASSLQQRRLIRYHRGTITVTDRRGLRAAACGCYEADRDSYKRILR